MRDGETWTDDAGTTWTYNAAREVLHGRPRPGPAPAQPKQCAHRGRQLGRQRIDDCVQRCFSVVYRCAQHGRATARRRVLRPGSLRPDLRVAICFGCPEYMDSPG